MHNVVAAATLPEAYHLALMRLNTLGEIRNCPAYNTKEKSISITVEVSRPLDEPRMSKFVPCGPYDLQRYLMEMKDGILDFEATITHNWTYTYHDRMAEQLVEVVRKLQKDRNSRRAVVIIRRPEDIYLDDPPCLTMIQYIINCGVLDCYVTFRSNDAVKAFYMNAFALIEIQKVLADILNVRVGHYVHTANSFHAYERDWDQLSEFCQKYTQENRVVYNSRFMTMEFEGMFKDLMEEEIPEIMDMVEHQMDKYNILYPGRYCGNLRNVIMREIGIIKNES